MLVGQQPVNQLFISVRRRVGEKLIYLLRTRRQPYEIQIDTADERLFRRFGRRREAFLFQSRQDEIVDRIAGPTLIFSLRQRGANWFDVSPMLRYLSSRRPVT